MADEEERKELRAGPDGAAAGGKAPAHEMLVKIHSEVLGCRICLKLLTPPIFKCEAGHILCSPCVEKLREVGYVMRLGIFCVHCCKNTSYSRCVELEEFMDAIKVPCSNSRYGCTEFIRHHQKEKHESACTHAPCFCPENNCTFSGATGPLLDHLVTEHRWSPASFCYNKPLKVSVARDRRFTLLVGEDSSVFLLCNTLTDIGSALAMVCVRPHDPEPSYSCSFSVTDGVVAGDKGEGRLVFLKDARVSSSSLFGGVQLGTRFFLLVPAELAGAGDELTVHIRIDRPA